MSKVLILCLAALFLTVANGLSCPSDSFTRIDGTCSKCTNWINPCTGCYDSGHGVVCTNAPGACRSQGSFIRINGECSTCTNWISPCTACYDSGNGVVCTSTT